MTRALRFACLVLGGLISPGLSVATAAQAAPQAVAACVPDTQAVFGTKQKTDVSMEGKIYYLPTNARGLPDFASLPSHGSIFTDKWDITERAFSSGFPGVTDRFEWFALDYRGAIYVPVAGRYAFRLNSDDGSKLYLDDSVVVDNDGVHGMIAHSGTVKLAQGAHAFRLSYFQGPAYEIGLEFYVTPPAGKEKIFELQDFNKSVVANRRLLGVTESDKEILVRLGAAVLFETGKYDLKSQALASLQGLAVLLRGYPGYPIVIEGHTDNVGIAAANETLSERRASSVKDWLVSHAQIAAACISTKGYGSTQPVATNATATGRQKNRRVEIRLEKPRG
jgi:outer membrane protein OmpA-like peptidoglycan-associated protein